MSLKMHYKKIIKLFFFLFLTSCVNTTLDKSHETTIKDSYFLNKGFAIVYHEDLYKNKLIKGKIDNRSLIIFQKNLSKGSSVKITNLLNSKYLVAKVGKKTDYPFFYNSVISKRINDELELDVDEPYIEIKEIIHGSSFVAKKAKTHDEEKMVAAKAPVEDIQIKNLNSISKKKISLKNKKFSYIIKIADFYFNESAIQMKSRIIDETSIKKVNIKKISKSNFRVFLGPYHDLNSLKTSFNAINVLGFENIEIIKK